MTDFSTLLSHPDSEHIISKLVLGTTAKEISGWLKVKYSSKEQKHLHLSAKIIQDYANAHVGNMMDHFNKDLQALKKNVINENIERQATSSLMNNKTYKERLQEISATELDIKQEIKNLLLIVRERIEQVFDRIQENSANFKGDYVLIQYFNTLLSVIEKYDKICNNAPDQIIQHNISIQMIGKVQNVFQEAIRKTLSRLDTETSIAFIEDIGEAMEALQLEGTSATPESREAEFKMLQEFSVPEADLKKDE